MVVMPTKQCLTHMSCRHIQGWHMIIKPGKVITSKLVEVKRRRRTSLIQYFMEFLSSIRN